MRCFTVRMICAALMGAGLVVGWTMPVDGEPSLGLTGGLTFAGDQDVTIIDRNGGVKPTDKSAAIGPVGGIAGTYWWKHLGLQLDGLYWHTSAQAALPGSFKRASVNEDRGALLLSLLGRVSFGEADAPFVYGGLGAGGVFLGVSPGQTTLERAVGALAGVAIPITTQLRLRTEVRYLLTHDVDPKPGRGTATEVSGHRGENPGRALFGPHFDTQFVPVVFGLDYVF